MELDHVLLVHEGVKGRLIGIFGGVIGDRAIVGLPLAASGAASIASPLAGIARRVRFEWRLERPGFGSDLGLEDLGGANGLMLRLPSQGRRDGRGESYRDYGQSEDLHGRQERAVLAVVVAGGARGLLRLLGRVVVARWNDGWVGSDGVAFFS